MASYPHCRILAIIGSGETSPTMVTVHRELVSRLRLSNPRAVLLATPYAFQENAADVSSRAQRYFADRGVSGGGSEAEGGEMLALPLPEIMTEAERRFKTAAGDRDAAAMTGLILELETAIRQWEADTDEDQGTEQARALLRSLIGRLGRAAQAGLTDPRDRLRPAVEPLLALRAALRGAGNFAAADAIRQALGAAGLDVSDTPEGTRWQPTELEGRGRGPNWSFSEPKGRGADWTLSLPPDPPQERRRSDEGRRRQ